MFRYLDVLRLFDFFDFAHYYIFHAFACQFAGFQVGAGQNHAVAELLCIYINVCIIF